MAKQRHLSKPPIVEALIDFRVRFGEESQPDRFETFGDLVSERYPKRETRMAHSFAVKIEKNQPQPPVQESVIDGYTFQSVDGSEVVQSKPTGFSFSKLKPYVTWEATLAEAWRLWLLYRDRYRPIGVARIAARYINRLEFPGPAVDLDDYLTIAPKLPPSIPQAITNFSTRLVLPVADKTVAILRCTDQVAAVAANTIPIILDLDIIREAAIDPSDDATMLRALEELRTIKNTVFFDSLTEKAVEVFA